MKKIYISKWINTYSWKASSSEKLKIYGLLKCLFKGKRQQRCEALSSRQHLDEERFWQWYQWMRTEKGIRLKGPAICSAQMNRYRHLLGVHVIRISKWKNTTAINEREKFNLSYCQCCKVYELSKKKFIPVPRLGYNLCWQWSFVVFTSSSNRAKIVITVSLFALSHGKS